MFIAQKLKKENICEYLLYMWQIEDLLRAFRLDINNVSKQIIDPYPISEEEKKTLYQWYESLIEMMRIENVAKKGHLQINKNVVNQLDEFHSLMLRSGADAAYNMSFRNIQSYLQQLYTSQSNREVGSIEICFNFQYGIMLLRMKKTDLTPATEKARQEIARFMAILSANYKKYQNGELALDEESMRF
ncbi:MAG: DUF4924 family protein [Paludibacteraceae bacterium]